MSNKFLGLNSINVLKDYIDKHIEEEFDRIEIENTEGTIIMPEISIIKDEEDGNSYWAVDGVILEVDGERCRANGDQGPEGPQGDIGPEGPQGKDGKPADVISYQYCLGTSESPFHLLALTTSEKMAHLFNNAWDQGVECWKTNDIPSKNVTTHNNHTSANNIPAGQIINVKDAYYYVMKQMGSISIPYNDSMISVNGNMSIKYDPSDVYIWCRTVSVTYTYNDSNGEWEPNEPTYGSPYRIEGTNGPEGPQGDIGPEGPQGPQGIDGKPADVITEKYSLGSEAYAFIPNNSSFLSKEDLPIAKIYELNDSAELSSPDVVALPFASVLYLKKNNIYLLKSSQPGISPANGQQLTDILQTNIGQIFPNNDTKIYIWRVLGTQTHTYNEETGNWILDESTTWSVPKRTEYIQGLPGPQGPQGIDGRPADVITEKYSLGSVAYPFITRNDKFLSKEELPAAKAYTIVSVNDFESQDIKNLPLYSVLYIEYAKNYVIKVTAPGEDVNLETLSDFVGRPMEEIFLNNNTKIYIWRVLGRQHYNYNIKTQTWELDSEITWDKDPVKTEYIQGMPGPQGPKGEPGEGVAPMIDVKHGVLVQMIANDALIPGQQYRITDFVTTCNTQGAYDTNVITSSANHQFDIIVTADTVDTLNANARVCLHEFEDTTPDEVSKYFVNNKLSEWKIKYDINNYINKYKWVDTRNGKGVIYWMQDEFGNEACYDFKNILFNDCYTFDFCPNPAKHIDFSLSGVYCYENKIKGYYDTRTPLQYLNNNLCLTTQELPIALNIFGTNTHSCIINTSSTNNHIGNNCSYINISERSGFINVINIYGNPTKIINIDPNPTNATITVAKNSSGDIIRYCEADLAALLLAPEQTQE